MDPILGQCIEVMDGFVLDTDDLTLELAIPMPMKVRDPFLKIG